MLQTSNHITSKNYISLYTNTKQSYKVLPQLRLQFIIQLSYNLTITTSTILMDKLYKTLRVITRTRSYCKICCAVSDRNFNIIKICDNLNVKCVWNVYESKVRSLIKPTQLNCEFGIIKFTKVVNSYVLR